MRAHWRRSTKWRIKKRFLVQGAVTKDSLP